MMENLPLQYVMDQEGNATAVVIPIAQWNKLVQELQHLKEYRTLKGKLATGFEQVIQMKEGKLPKVSLSSFLDEG